jgi:hypothetical protein
MADSPERQLHVERNLELRTISLRAGSIAKAQELDKSNRETYCFAARRIDRVLVKKLGKAAEFSRRLSRVLSACL